MKSLTKKLLASVFVMVFALVAVATTTFAWFTISNEATVGPIDVDVRADSEDLTVKVLKSTVTGTPGTAADSTGFIKGLTQTEINKAIYGTTTDGTVVFDAVSSIDGTSFYKLNAPTGAYTVDGTTWRGAAPQANYKGSYLSFVLEFKSSSTGYLVLTKNTGATADNTTLSSLVNFTWNGTAFEEGATIAANAVDALRMSFTSVGKTVTQKTILYNPKSDVVHKVTSDDGVIQGVAEGTSANNIGVLYYQNVWKNNGTVKTNLDLALKTDGATINALKYASNLPEPTALTAENYETLKTTYAVIGMFGTKTSDVVDTIKVTVNLWLEGWDADCFNAILKSNLKISLGFGILPTALTEDVDIYAA